MSERGDGSSVTLRIPKAAFTLIVAILALAAAFAIGMILKERLADPLFDAAEQAAQDQSAAQEEREAEAALRKFVDDDNSWGAVESLEFRLIEDGDRFPADYLESFRTRADPGTRVYQFEYEVKYEDSGTYSGNCIVFRESGFWTTNTRGVVSPKQN